MLERDMVSKNVVIMGYAQNEHDMDAKRIINELNQHYKQTHTMKTNINATQPTI